MHIYRNSLHGTETKSKYSPEELQQALEKCGSDFYFRSSNRLWNAAKALKRIRKTLCPFIDCGCGNAWGEID